MQCQRSGQRWYAVEIFLCHELHHVIDNHSRDLQASNCAKEITIKPGKATRSKRQLFKTFQKLTVKAQSIAASSSLISGAVLTQHKGKYCQTVTTPRGVL